MKILHTADWHVGKTLRGRSRAGEHREVLDEIAGIAEREEVDLVLVAGDQFDRAIPTAESQEIVYNALLRLADTGARVVVIAGNHDDPRKLQAIGPLLELANITAAATVRRPDEGGVLHLATPRGEEAVVALFPFQSKRGIVKATDLMEGDPDDHQKNYSGRCRKIAEALCAPFRDDTVNLVAAHLTVVGSRTGAAPTRGGGERGAHTVLDYYVPADIFPDSAHYVALGHIHKPQQIGGRCPIWYSGSPFALDFGETERRHRVLIIEARPGAPAEIRPVYLKSGRRLRTIRGSRNEVESHAGTTGDDYLRIIVRTPPSPGLAEGIRELFPQAVDVVVDPPETDQSKSEALGASSLQGDPGTLFRRYLTEQGIEGEALAGLFDELLDEHYGSEDRLQEEEHAPAPA